MLLLLPQCGCGLLLLLPQCGCGLLRVAPYAPPRVPRLLVQLKKHFRCPVHLRDGWLDVPFLPLAVVLATPESSALPSIAVPCAQALLHNPARHGVALARRVARVDRSVGHGLRAEDARVRVDDAGVRVVL